jgi:proteasome activator subunit 4
MDPGVVGKSVKTVLSDFKKTRQDTWHVDVKVSTTPLLTHKFVKTNDMIGLRTRTARRLGGCTLEELLCLEMW